MKIGILFQDLNRKKIAWQKHGEIYTKTAKRVVEINNALIALGHETTIFSSLEDFLNRHNDEAIDLVFPFIECCFERNTNAFIPALLQMLNIPFIGNDSFTYTIASDKFLFKKIAHSFGIHTPKSKIIYKSDYPSKLLSVIDEIGFPCIVKYQYGSMSYHTVQVSDYELLKKQIRFMVEQENGPVLCEEYIEGYELSVPVVGTAPEEHILAVIEYTDSEGKPLEIYDDLWKFKNDSQVELKMLNNTLPHIKEIISSVHSLYSYLGFHDYARFDFRLDYNGQPFLLEANPLPALEYESAFDPISYGNNFSFKRVLSLIVQSAAERYNLTSI